MATIGTVNRIPVRTHDFEWEISNFFSLSNEVGIFYSSPPFSFANESWCLRIYPNGHDSNDSVGYIGLYLIKNFSDSSITLKYFLGLKSSDGKKDKASHGTQTFEKKEDGFGNPKCISKTELGERKSELVLNNVCTVFCTLVYAESIGDANGRFLCEDYKKVLLNGLNHDLILKVGGKDLRAHQDILRVRSCVFESMLRHDMKEKNSGVIDIPDCDPQAMEQFLLYIYSGKVDKLDNSNMLKLYYIADKYDVKGLKDESHIFIKNSLSLTNVCEVIRLSLNHNDSNLTDFATDYFMNNTVEIMHTREWESFMKENFTFANELTIKALEKLKIAII